MSLRIALIPLFLGTAISCKTAPKDEKVTEKDEPETVAKKAQGASVGEIDWLQDNYSEAIQVATRTERPLVIKMWAPWCHTCLSMKEFVLKDPGLVALGDRFVWLAMDTDRPENDAALKKLPVSSWPTFFVLNPNNEKVLARHLGAASIRQLRDVFALGESAFRNTKGAKSLSTVETLLVKGDQSFQQSTFETATKSYAAALDKAPTDWPLAPETAVKWISSSLKGGGECPLAKAKSYLDIAAQGSTASLADYVYYVTKCVDKNAGKVGAKEKQSTLELSSELIEKALANAAAPLSVDDRSDSMRILREIKTTLGKAEAAKKIATQQLALLETTIENAPSPFAAMTYNWPLLEVSIFLDKTERVLPTLENSYKALPNEYDPAYRFASALHLLKRNSEALPVAQKAVQLSYGPRKKRVKDLLVDIEKALSNP